MVTFFRLILLDPIALIFAFVAAGATMAVSDLFPKASGDIGTVTLIALSWTMAVVSAWFGFVPAVVAILLAEVFGWRSVFYWLAVGGGLGLAGFAATTPAASPAIDYALAPFVGGGLIGGLVYWSVAGQWSGIAQPAAQNRDKASPPVD